MQKHVRAVVSLVLKSGREKMNVHDVNGAHGVVVSHPLSMREALGSIPSVSILGLSEKCNFSFEQNVFFVQFPALFTTPVPRASPFPCLVARPLSQATVVHSTTRIRATVLCTTRGCT